MKRLKRIPDWKDIPPIELSKEYIDKLADELLAQIKSPGGYWAWPPLLPKEPTIVDGVTLVEDE